MQKAIKASSTSSPSITGHILRINTYMMISSSRKNVFVLLLSMIISLAALLIASAILLPIPSFADRIYVIRQGTTLALGCDLTDDDFVATTKVFKYDQPNKLIFNCERSGGGGDVDLKKGESIALRCLHDNPITNARDAKMKLGELFYIICKQK
jgi:hypothetical protein